MIDLSYAGLAGASVGLVLAAVIYGRLADAIERAMRARHASNAEDRGTFAQELALLRRGVLAFDILICGGIGYWVGDSLGG